MTKSNGNGWHGGGDADGDNDASFDPTPQLPKHQHKLTMQPPKSPGGYLVFKDNKPTMVYNAPPEGLICKTNIVDKFYQVLSAKYNGRIYDPVTRLYIEDERPEMIGKQNIDVLLENTVNSALMGDFEKTKFLIEHTKGKPSQENHNFNVDATQTYRDFVEQCAIEEDDTLGYPQQPVLDATEWTVSDEELLQDDVDFEDL